MIVASSRETQEAGGGVSADGDSPTLESQMRILRTVRGRRFSKPPKKKVQIRCPVGDETKWIVPSKVSVDVDNAKETFLLFDTQHMGFFTERDVQEFFGDDNERFTEFIDRFDADRDGQITFLEFRSTLDEFVETRVELSIWERIFIVFSEPSSCILAKWISVFIIILIIISTVSFVLETETSLYLSVPDSHECCSDVLVEHQLEDDFDMSNKCPCPPVPMAWFADIEAVCIYCFAVEYLIRVCTVWKTPFVHTFDVVLDVVTLDKKPQSPLIGLTRLRDFVLSPMNLIDLCAVLPYFVSEFMSNGNDSGFGFLRVLRLARVFRVFKMGKYNAGMQMFTKVMIKSSSALNLLCFFAALGMVLFGSLIYFFEGGEFKVTSKYENGAYMRKDKYGNWDVTPFESIPSCFWWVVVTQTTVGYGDAFPITSGGKLIGCFAMLTGVLILALPITIIGANFATEYQRSIAEEKRNVAKEREALAREVAAAAIARASVSDSSERPGRRLSSTIKRRLSSVNMLRRTSLRVSSEELAGLPPVRRGPTFREDTNLKLEPPLLEHEDTEESTPPPPATTPPLRTGEPLSPVTPAELNPEVRRHSSETVITPGFQSLTSPSTGRKYVQEPNSPGPGDLQSTDSRPHRSAADFGLLVTKQMVQVTAMVHSYQDKHRLTDMAGEALIRELSDIVEQVDKKNPVSADELMRTLNMCWNWLERSCMDEGTTISKREKQLLFKAILDLVSSAVPVAPDNFR